MSVTIALGLTLTIPAERETNWYQKFDALARAISSHTHQGSGAGVQIGTAALANNSVTLDKLAGGLGGAFYAGVTGGSGDTFTLTATGYGASYSDGDSIIFKTNRNNTTTTPTLNLNGIGAKTMVRHDGTALAAGDIPNGEFVAVVYEATSQTFRFTRANHAVQLKSGALTSSLNFGLQKAEAMAGATSATDGVNVNTLNSAIVNGGTSGGVANAYTCSSHIANSASLTIGQLLSLRIHATNTGASTLNAMGLGILSIVTDGGTSLLGGELRIGDNAVLRYDGTYWTLVASSGGVITNQLTYAPTILLSTVPLSPSAYNVDARYDVIQSRLVRLTYEIEFTSSVTGSLSMSLPFAAVDTSYSQCYFQTNINVIGAGFAKSTAGGNLDFSGSIPLQDGFRLGGNPLVDIDWVTGTHFFRRS